MSKAIEIMYGVWLVGRSNWGGLEPLTGDGDCNIWLLDGGSELALIDAGGGENIDELIANIEAAGRKPEQVSKILLTHSHFDHFFGAPEWQRRFGSEIVVHEVASERLELSDMRLTGLYLLEEWPELGDFRITREVTDGDVVNVGSLAFEVMHVPGHVPDAVAYAVETGGQRLVFSGDAAIGDQDKAKGCVGWMDGLWESNIYDFQHSVERLLAERIDVLCPGHGIWHEGEAVRSSLKNCKWRLDQVAALPDLGCMIPITHSDPSFQEDDETG